MSIVYHLTILGLYHHVSQHNMIMIDKSLKDWDLYNKVACCVYRYKKILLSYSGGLDSTVLLHILVMLKKGIGITNIVSIPLILRAVYVHHGISSYADEWAKHCLEQCAIRDIPFHIIRINCAHKKSRQSNIEALARDLRYQALFNSLNTEEILVTAHHMDDQVESLFLALKRGSGPTGLSAMAENTLYYNKYRLLRPLLYCSRKQLEVYAHRNKINWIEDDTNTDVRFDRNFLRIKILPLFYRRWPYFNKVVTRTALLCRDQENVLNEFLSESLKKLVSLSDGSLYFKPLFQYTTSKRRVLLRRWLVNFSINIPSYKIINRIWKEIVLSRKDAAPMLQFGKCLCRRFHERLYILPDNMKYSLNTIRLFWNIKHNTISLPHNLGILIHQLSNINEYIFKDTSYSDINTNALLSISYDLFGKSGKILTHCFVRPPKYNENVSIILGGNINGLLYIFGRNHGRRLKKIWQELNIPPWLRSRIPLLFYNDTLITAIGVFITKDGKIKNKQNMPWKISWLLHDTLYYNVFKNSINFYLK